MAQITTTNYTNYTSGSPTGSSTSSAYFISSDYTGFGNLNSAASTGSGVFTTMFRTSDDNDADAIERGFNSSNGLDPNNSTDNNPNPRYDQNSGNVQNPIAKPLEMTVVNIGGEYYFEFMLDGNESDNYISIDQIMVFTTDGSTNLTLPAGVESSNPTPNNVDVMSYFNSNVTANLVYSLDEFNSSGTATTDNTLLVYFENAGSGKPDFAMYIPVNSVIQGDNAIHADTGRVYFWTEMGGAGTLSSLDFGASSTFEEWAYLKSGTSYEVAVPEPGTYATALLLLILAAVSTWKHRRNRTPLDATPA
jgi:hypothetical protein